MTRHTNLDLSHRLVVRYLARSGSCAIIDPPPARGCIPYLALRLGGRAAVIWHDRVWWVRARYGSLPCDSLYGALRHALPYLEE